MSKQTKTNPEDPIETKKETFTKEEIDFMKENSLSEEDYSEIRDKIDVNNLDEYIQFRKK